MARSQIRHPETKGDEAASSKKRSNRKGVIPRRGRYQTRQTPADLNTLSGRIRAGRMALDLNQSELARLLNTDQTSVSAWEVGKTAPSGPTLAGLSRVFKTSVDALETGVGFELLQPSEIAARIDPGLDLSRLPPVPAGSGGVILHRQGLAIESLGPRKLLALVQRTIKAGHPVWLILD